ncbi:MAG: radical SAM protein [Anaerolineae bacterium]|nr:radical SAM protein [Anaerolineae bacterium]
MGNLLGNYVLNLAKLLGGGNVLRPLVAVYHVTAFCNLNCRYCEDYGAVRNVAAAQPLSLPDAQRVLEIVRQGTDRIIFTGGEPLLYPHIDALLAHAHDALAFRSVTLLTNGLLLPDHERALAHVDRLIVSLDSVEPDVWDQTLRSGVGTAARILDAVAAAAGRQRALGVRIVVNCVLAPETLDQVDGVIDFCQRHGLALSISPCAQNNWPRYELLVSEPYRALLRRLEDLKRNGFPLLVSRPTLRVLAHFEPFKCYPTLFPQVFHDGTLAYPCRPIQKSGTTHGGLCNLLEAGSWRRAMAQAVGDFDVPPLVCTSCFQQCYVEPSLMQARPLALLWELARYPTCRQAELVTYAPG